MVPSRPRNDVSGRWIRSLQPRIYLESEIAFMKQVAQQVAVALDNALNSESTWPIKRN